ncbi:type IV toxin-antitoxin system AbiEi family antitoxin domain-containing protein [Facklamia sp. P13055]|uniref:type IV toxin-antitoxin system AbiEi family antitoxin domain-containing protein n=1 Tax=unclassified Facklamia TaxID=2622293 RepID=UPI003D172F44
MNKEKDLLEKLSDEHGLIFVREAEAKGIDRYRLSYLAKEDKIERVGHGVYTLKDEIIDDYVLLQRSSKRVIYSYHTALYFHDLADRVPSQIHISVPQGYNASRLKERFDDLVVHYVKIELFELGREMTTSPLGGEIILYDVERTICDIVKDQRNIDSQIFTGAIKEYFGRGNINFRKLIKYARALKVEEEIRRYLEVMI